MDDLPRSVGRYEILEELGRGSMSRVYLAYDSNLDRKVAVKVLRSTGPVEVAEELTKRFVLEARAAGKLSHPGIVRVYDADTDPQIGVSYLAMEWVQGRSLQNLLEAEGRLEVRRAVEIAAQVAEALDYAHLCGRVHRDVKPSNILLGRGGEARVSDFGVAKILSESHTITGHLLGTPLYMSPEQVAGEPVDGRSDLFSLGVVLYRSVSGSVPFGGDSLISVAYKIVNVDPRPLPLKRTEPSQLLGSVLERLLMKDPRDRYQTGAEVADALREVGDKWVRAAGEEVLSLPTWRPRLEPAADAGRSRVRSLEDTQTVSPTEKEAEPAGKEARDESTVEILTPPVRQLVDIRRPPHLAKWRPEWEGRRGPRRSSLVASVLCALLVTALAVAVIGRRSTLTPDAIPEVPEQRQASRLGEAPESSAAPTPIAVEGMPVSELSSRLPSAAGEGEEPTASKARPEVLGRGGAEPSGLVALSTLEILYRHRSREGYVSVWVDREKVWTERLTGSRNPFLWIVGYRARALLKVPEGLHSVEVRVTAPAKGIDAARVVRRHFRGGETRRRRVSVERKSNRLRLHWET